MVIKYQPDTRLRSSLFATMRRIAGFFDGASIAEMERDIPPAEQEGARGKRALSVAKDFAPLRKRLLILVDSCAETGAIRAQMRLSDRDFGELWAACSCNGDFEPRRTER